MGYHPLILCVAALVGTLEADQLASSCSTDSEAQTSGTVLLQKSGELSKKAPPEDQEKPEDQEDMAELQNEVKTSNTMGKKPKKKDFDFGGKNDNNNMNDNNNFAFNNNGDKDDKKKKEKGSVKDFNIDKITETDDLANNNNDNNNALDKEVVKEAKGDNNNNLDINNNNNALDKEVAKDLEGDKDKADKGDGKKKEGKDDHFNFGENDNLGGNAIDELDKAVENNFDFGNDASHHTDIKAATEGLKKHVDNALDKISTVLDDAAASDQAIRKALDVIDSSPGTDDVKQVTKDMQIALAKAQEKVQEAQDQLKELQDGVNSGTIGKSAAGLSSTPHAWLFGWMCSLGMLQLWML